MQQRIMKSFPFFNKSISAFIIILTIFSIPNQCFAKEPKANEFQYCNTMSGVPVGNRTGDSTGSIAISNASIQQSILSTIPFFSNWIIATEEATLSVNLFKSYLTFKITGATGNATATVAVELNQENNSLVFLPHSDSEIFFFVTYGNCTDLKFLRDANKKITGCTCTAATSANQAPSGSKFLIIKAH